jgi:hypothetical protein
MGSKAGEQKRCHAVAQIFDKASLIQTLCVLSQNNLLCVDATLSIISSMGGHSGKKYKKCKSNNKCKNKRTKIYSSLQNKQRSL